MDKIRQHYRKYYGENIVPVVTDHPCTGLEHLMLGFCHQYGIDMPIDLKQATHEFQEAINCGEKKGLTALASLCGGEPARQLYRQAAEQGDPYAQYFLGCLYRQSHQYEQAVHYTTLAVAQNYPYAMNTMALLYQNGQGVPVSTQTAIEYFERGIALGDLPSLHNLAHLHKSLCNYPQAIQLYTRATAQGSPESAYNLGLMYQRGVGLPVDYVKASELYQMAADKGHAKACFCLGNLYETHLHDPHKAMEYFARATRVGGTQVPP
jgi:TPR repeat protein